MTAPSVPILKAALACRCPRCGQGKLFRGVLTVRDRCDVCGLNLSENDTGDGPAVGLIFVLGVVIIGLAFWVDNRFRPALWVHAVLWPVLTLALTVLLMRPLKAAMVAIQYRTRSSEMGL